MLVRPHGWPAGRAFTPRPPAAPRVRAVRPTRPTSSGSQAAFTLIELLVVIAIITMLIAILMPSLSAARRQTKQTVCLTRIRGIASAALVYASEDPNGWAIPAHPLQYAQDPHDPIYMGAYEWGGKSGIGRDGFLPGSGGAYAYLTSRYGTKAGFGPATRPLNAVLYPQGFTDHLNTNTGFDREGATRDTRLQLDMYECPSDDGPPRGAHCDAWVKHPDRSSYDHYGTSYAANRFMVNCGSCIASNSPFLRSVTRVPSPVRTLMFEENIGRFAWAARRSSCDDVLGLDELSLETGPTKSLRGWHGNDWTYNRAFVDGHAETQKVYIEGTEDENGYALHYVNEELQHYPPMYRCPDAKITAGMGGANLRYAYSCVTIRGPGWQKDTLPAPFIHTGLSYQGNSRGEFAGCISAPNGD